MDVLHITLRPHVEARCGREQHVDRFAAVLGEAVVHVGRSGWHGVARALLKLGYPPHQRMHVQHEGRAFDPTIQPRTLEDLAEWTVEESDRKGMRLRKWQPFELI